MKQIENSEDIFNDVKNALKNEIDYTHNIILDEMAKEKTPESIKKITNLFIIISNLNQAQTLVKAIKTPK